MATYRPEEPTPTQKRKVLAEIPTVGEYISPIDPAQSVHRIDVFYNYLGTEKITPTTNPDELAIQLRGRRSIRVKCSPDVDVLPEREDGLLEDDEFEMSQINTSLVALNNTARKKLMYDDSFGLSSQEESNLSEEDLLEKEFESLHFDTGLTVFNDTAQKRLMYEDSFEQFYQKKYCLDLHNLKNDNVMSKFEFPKNNNCLESALEALSKDQLIRLLSCMILDCPNTEKRSYTNATSIADLKSLKTRVNNLRRNIYKALASSKVASKTSAMAYRKVSVHLMKFKRCVIDEGRRLIDGNQWLYVMKYVFMAWKLVDKTPVWDVSAHNVTRKQCFKSLSSMFKVALEHEKDNLSNNRRAIYKNRLKSWSNYSACEDIISCLKLLDNSE